jgi:glycosyltransferase involved in cell wall biosynthesis
VQACNPPDLIFIIGAFWKYLFGKPFLFDHHDINPELYEAKFGRCGAFHSLLLKLERWTFATADASIATNETFKSIAVARGGMAPDRVFVVRSIPDLSRFKRIEPDAKLRNGRRNVIGYVGIMGAQDGVDLLIEAMAHLVNAQGRTDTQCVIVGSGTELDRLKGMVAAHGLTDYVTFTGFLSGQPLLRAFSTFDIGAIPDPKNGYNDKISMNKVFEYMSLGIPFVQFDLDEGMKVAGEAALVARNNSPIEFADQMARLLHDATLRDTLAEIGRVRAKALLRWETERAQLLAAYDCILKERGSSAAVAIPQG